MSDPRTALERLLGAASVETLEKPALPLASPESESQLVEIVKLAAAERWTVLPVGLGSKLSWLPSSRGADFALTTRRLTGIVAYEPGDGTMTARAGSRIADLASATRAKGNQLTPCVPRPDRATLGGVLAAGQSGMDRLRHGPSRHHVLGMRVVLADGSVAKSGGRLVKNVTGYDLHRLYCGSQGTLCVIVEASMRLSAAPEGEVVLTANARDRSDALEKAGAALALDLRPLCVRAENVLDSRNAWRVHVVLSGRSGFVDWARRKALEAIPGAAEGRETIERIRDAELAGGGWPSLRIAGRISRFGPAMRTLAPDLRMVVEPSIAVAEILDASNGTARALGDLGLEVTLRGSAVASPPGAAGDIARRLHDSLDPSGTLARL
ncbi:MAG: FAD-binding oxidoreductase [Planctomycetota bacterium]